MHQSIGFAFTCIPHYNDQNITKRGMFLKQIKFGDLKAHHFHLRRQNLLSGWVKCKNNYADFSG